jgi:hypothetical protein
VPAEAQTLAYWLGRYSAAELDAVLMDESGIAAYDARVGKRQGRAEYSQHDLRVPADPLALGDDVRARLSQLQPDVIAGKLLGRDGTPLDEAARAPFGAPVKLQPAGLRVLRAPTLLRCGPYDGSLYKSEVELPYDRNACGVLHAQEPLEVLGKSSGGLLLVRSRFSLGFLSADAQLSPALPASWQASLLGAPRLYAPQDLKLPAANGGESQLILAGTALPDLGHGEVGLATASGIVRMPRPPALEPKPRNLTRRALLTAAFAQLDKPYGLGGAEGGLDCSSLLLELFERFDIALPRFSGWQAQSGTYSVDVRADTPAQKLAKLDLAAKSGAVLLYFPGHIMLYLGRDAAGNPLAIHALGEYVKPCAAGETIVDVQRVVVSGFELGKGTSRHSFSERLSQLVVFGAPPPQPLAAGSDLGPAAPPEPIARDASCQDSADDRIFISPQNPVAGEALRAIAASTNDPGSASLRIFEADGESALIDEFALGGPPYGHVAKLAKPRPGLYTAVLGSGSEHRACRRFRVAAAHGGGRGHAERTERAERTDTEEPVWEPKNRWERDDEALYALFVEQLFAGPPDDEQTWTNLHSLLRDPSRNLLFGHLGLDEESHIEIEPDCADLPYALRAYFAWKLKLPFGFRQCSRGRTDHPPSCGELHTSLEARKAPDDVVAFSQFVNRSVRAGVHSATGRTGPDDDATDLYPVALERSALPPGTVFADPYGHVLMISKWFAQGSLSGSKYGVLIGAEAQPDGTIGRRRFWQGSFLFDPNTSSVGAGFKRFRPLSYERADRSITALDNDALRKQKEFPRWSRGQYEGAREDFYDRMETLINPTPLSPSERMLSLVAALEEAARRRVLSVDNGEQYARSHPQATIAMPQGHEIFETEGAWEDFATPSRDMRLLIAIDTVTNLPSQLEQHPERFALPAGTPAPAAAQTLRAALERELEARSFPYTRSDGSAQALRLSDVIARADALEVAYNPNDCVEVRWGAPLGSAERATCKRSAPPAQQSRMQAYRGWFHRRTRPQRGE